MCPGRTSDGEAPQQRHGRSGLESFPVVRQTAVTGWTGMGTASATATLGASPVAGNLLVFTFTCLRGGSAPLIQPTGTTLYGQIFSTITLGGNEVAARPRLPHGNGR